MLSFQDKLQSKAVTFVPRDDTKIQLNVGDDEDTEDI